MTVGIFIFLIISELVIPITMVIAGLFMYKRPPKDINSVVGYRTKRSMRNKDTWRFAHYYCGRLWIKLGIILLIITAISVVPQFMYMDIDDEIISIACMIITALQLVIMILSIFFVEKALKKNFG